MMDVFARKIFYAFLNKRLLYLTGWSPKSVVKSTTPDFG